MTPDHAIVAQVIDRLIQTWNRNRMDQMDVLWDQDDPAPFDLAEEEPAPATTWDEVRDYWRRTQALNEKIAVEISDPTSKSPGTKPPSSSISSIGRSSSAAIRERLPETPG